VPPFSRHGRSAASPGAPSYPDWSLTDPAVLRAIVGTAAVLAAIAVFSLALGTVLRRAAGAVAAVIVLIILPQLLASGLPTAAGQWLMRLTPATGFSIQQTTRHYDHVPRVCLPEDGCVYDQPWAGFAVICGYALVTMAVGALAAAPEGRVSTVHAVRAEWTKLRTVVSTPWLVFAAVAVTVGIGGMVTAAASTRRCPTPSTCFEDLPKLGLTGAQYGQVAVVVLAVLVMSEEYGTRSIGVTLAAVPRRWRLYLSKAAVLTGLVAVVGSLGVLGSLLVARRVLPGNGFNATNGYRALSLGDEPTLRAVYGTVLYLALVALLRALWAAGALLAAGGPALAAAARRVTRDLVVGRKDHHEAPTSTSLSLPRHRRPSWRQRQRRSSSCPSNDRCAAVIRGRDWVSGRPAWPLDGQSQVNRPFRQGRAPK
jgi:hypothetical protein